MVGRKLGRGLQFLLSDRGDREPVESAEPEAPADAEAPRAAGSDTPLEVPLSALEANPFQPRKHFKPDEIASLARSIREKGILQPILVRERGDGFEIIAGERRARAAREAGLDRVPVVVRAVDDVDMRLLALVENLQRSDLDPIEKALSFKELKTSTRWTHERIAKAVGLDRSSVSNYLRLLELPQGVRRQLREGKLTMGHARALLQAPEQDRDALAERVIEGALSVRATEQLAASGLPLQPSATDPEDGARPRGRPSKKPAWAREMEQNLLNALGCPVTVSYRGGKGRIVLDVGDRKEFDRVFELLMGS